MKTIYPGIVVLATTLMWLNLARPADRMEIIFPGDHAYPESLTATSDGTIYAGSLYQGGIFRVPPGGDDCGAVDQAGSERFDDHAGRTR
jgi:hypothetical protein